MFFIDIPFSIKLTNYTILYFVNVRTIKINWY